MIIKQRRNETKFWVQVCSRFHLIESDEASCQATSLYFRLVTLCCLEQKGLTLNGVATLHAGRIETEAEGVKKNRLPELSHSKLLLFWDRHPSTPYTAAGRLKLAALLVESE